VKKNLAKLLPLLLLSAALVARGGSQGGEKGKGGEGSTRFQSYSRSG